MIEPGANSSEYPATAKTALVPFPLLLTAGVLSLCLLYLPFVLPPGVFLGLLLLLGTLVVALTASWLRWGTPYSLVSLFFVIASFHALFGYFTAQPSSDTIWIESFFDRAYEEAFLVVAIGLFFSALGFAWTVAKSGGGWEGRWASLVVNERRLLIASRLGVLLGSTIMFYIALQLDYAPILASAPGVARYVTASLTDDFRQYEWFLNRAMDLLTYCLPLLLLPRVRGRLRVDSLLAIVGCLALLVPLRRANVLSLVFMVFLCGFLRDRKKALRYLAILPLFALVYFASQIAFLDVLGLDWDQRVAISIVGSALPEVRDLGWMTSLLDGQRFYGATLIQPFVMLPSFLSDYSQNYSLRAISTKLIGLDAEGQTGGLRVTLAGEGFLNFGYIGTMGVMLVLGAFTGFLDRALRSVQRSVSVTGAYLGSLGMVWLCFWLYLAGTQAAATIKIGLVVVALMMWFGQLRVRSV